MTIDSAKTSRNTYMIVIVAALGYFVDIYDLILFGVVRKASLTELIGADPEKIKSIGEMLLNWQMAGMLVGGIFWGVLGDKKGRLSVLFGSILTYSLANIANGMIDTIPLYIVCRFLAGVGLAGELGAGITLVSESMHKDKRGYGTMIVATVGVFGAVVAGLTGEFLDSWRYSYYLGGGMGIALLLLRIGIYESGMYEHVASSEVSKGNFFSLFSSRKTAYKYFSIIATGIPIWYVIGVLVTFSPETAKAMGMVKLPKAGIAVTFAFAGLTVGDFLSGMISQMIRSRKKTITLFLILTFLCVVSYFLFGHLSLTIFYTITFLLGLCTGYWAVFMSTASELFGTNIRSTVTTTAPNFVRGSLITTTLMIGLCKDVFGFSALTSIIGVGALLFAIAFICLGNIEETFGKDLDFVEE
ncbi:MAG: MFS transporter [Flavobacteriales bacterium]